MAREPQLKALERVRQIDRERAELIAEMKAEALDRVDAAIRQLAELGFDYRLDEAGKDTQPVLNPSGRTGRRRVNTERPCPICEFRTEPPHDARSHRGQVDKRPFTDDELEANHLARVATA